MKWVKLLGPALVGAENFDVGDQVLVGDERADAMAKSGQGAIVPPPPGGEPGELDEPTETPADPNGAVAPGKHRHAVRAGKPKVE